jgi:hypothetical protein
MMTLTKSGVKFQCLTVLGAVKKQIEEKKNFNANDKVVMFGDFY